VSTTSQLDAPPDVRLPRHSSVPPAVTSAGIDAVELAASAGLFLDPWQQYVLDGALGERADGKWSAFEVGLIVPRQNGKGSILEARELAGLFLFGENLILHSAHEFKTAQEAFRRILALIENTDALRKRVKRVRTSHGEEGVELLTGARLRFVARSTGSGRGFSGDTIILDEAYNLSADSMAALLPTLSARPNPQLWYASSAGLPSSDQLARVRERGRAGAPGLAFFDYCADEHADLDDVEAWAQANPAMPHRIPQEFVERERAAMPESEFARERLGIWADRRTHAVIDADAWHALADRSSRVLDPVAFAVDVTPDRRSASIGVAGARVDGNLHVEVVQTGRGTGWLADRLVELCGRNRALGVVVDQASAAASLVPELTERGLRVETTGTRDMANACGVFYDAVTERRLRHLDGALLNTTVASARKRPLGDAWAWQRRDGDTDLTPLVAVTLALWGFHNLDEPKPKRTGKVW